MYKFNFDEKKAITAVLYISKKIIDYKNNKIKPDFHKIFKTLYFADQKHLVRYGRPIAGDFYIAMDHGPVPSNIYDILKAAGGDSLFGDINNYASHFEIKGRFVHPKHDPDTNVLSESDLECIDESIAENANLTFSELKRKSHDKAYSKARKDDRISFGDIAQVGGADTEMLSYIKTISENERLMDS